MYAFPVLVYQESANCSAVDYNSWQESPEGLKLAAKLSKDTVLAEGTFHNPEILQHV